MPHQITHPIAITVSAVLSTLVLATEVAAQDVTASITASTPLTVRSSGAVTSLPAGPMQANGTLVAQTQTGGSSSCTWSTINRSSESSVNWDHTLIGDSSAGSHDIVVSFQSTSSVPARLEVRHQLFASPNTAVPTIAVDWNNDGTVDWIGGSDFVVVQNFQLTGQPTEVRVRFSGAIPVSTSRSLLMVRAVPNNGTLVANAGLGCSAGTYVMQPSFVGTGVVARSLIPAATPSVLVVGLTMQPVTLGNLDTLGFPCILFPSTDIVVPFAPALEIQIPLPQAVRPINFFAQRATLNFGEITTDNAYQIWAN